MKNDSVKNDSVKNDSVNDMVDQLVSAAYRAQEKAKEKKK